METCNICSAPCAKCGYDPHDPICAICGHLHPPPLQGHSPRTPRENPLNEMLEREHQLAATFRCDRCGRTVAHHLRRT